MYNIIPPETPAWDGPLEGGITQSLVNRFLDCPFRFYLYAVMGLEDPENINPNLIWGSICHRGLEHVVGHSTPIAEFTDQDKEELLQAIQDYTTKDYPQAPASFPLSTYQMCLLYDDKYKVGEDFKAEVKFQSPHSTYNNKVTIRGKLDGLGKTKMAEHKCVGYMDPGQARLETPHDLQLNLYMVASGARECIYDKIRIPDTNRWCPQKRSAERIAHWVHRIYNDHNYKEYPIKRNRSQWIDQFTIFRTDEEIEKYTEYVINPLIDLICAYWSKVTDKSFDPNNPKHYDELFWIKPIRTFDASRTEKYKPNYYNYLNGQISIDELRKTRFYQELQ